MNSNRFKNHRSILYICLKREKEKKNGTNAKAISTRET